MEKTFRTVQKVMRTSFGLGGCQERLLQIIDLPEIEFEADASSQFSEVADELSMITKELKEKRTNG